jgi:hypothetical protein
MSDLISTFVNDITGFQINIPIGFKIAVIVILIVILVIGSYFAYDFFEYGAMRQGYMWFVFIAIANLITILVIFYYYNTKKTTYIGPQGKRGKKGSRGKKGKYVSCNYCKNNIYLQRVRKSDTTATISTYTEEFDGIFKNVRYFNDIMDGNSDNISYDSFVNGILLSKTVDDKDTQGVDRFRSLMTSNSIAVYLIKIINENISKASNRTYGTFRKPYGKTGYTSLGDSVYGGLEKFELNSFVASGNVIYPSSYDQLVSFTCYNENTEDIDTYTIWRPVGQTITESDYKGNPVQYQYTNLGDVCRFGTEAPKLNDYVTIREDCLEETDPNDLIMAFLFVGNIQYSDKMETQDMTQSNSFLIENKVADDIQIFSVWRTPINTFLTNCNSLNELTNDTIATNMANELNGYINDYGTVSTTAKGKMKSKLQSISMPKILTAMIICRHYEFELRRELVYYVSKYQAIVPELANLQLNKFSLGDLVDKIKEIDDKYKKFNDDLVRNASFSLGDKAIEYDESKEKKLPSQLMNVYKSTNNTLLTISVKIENVDNFMDLIEVLFDNGLDTRIAVDSDGIAEGGILLNEIQETIVRICKMLMPPNQPAYTIKDECLGTFALDRDREEVIQEFTKVKNDYNKIMDEIANNSEKIMTLNQTVRQYENLLINKVGQLCGHIDNYMTKINDMNLEEFTTSRIKGLVSVYKEINGYLENAYNNS